LDACDKCDAEYVAKVAVFSRQRGFMKDMPALLCVYLLKRAPDLLHKAFPFCIDNGKMVRNFFQILRSGIIGRTSMAHLPTRLINGWINSRTPENLLFASVGNDPSLG